MPSTCAPMIGKTSSCAWWLCSTTTYPVRFIIEAITARLATAAIIAGTTPGRRRISLRGAALAGGVPSRAPSSSAIRLGSGRMKRLIAQATSARPPATSQGSVSASGSSCLPAKSGANTAGPRIAPKTEPKST